MPPPSDGTTAAPPESPPALRSQPPPCLGQVTSSRQHGIIALTSAAEIALQSLPADRTSDAVEQTDEREQVHDPQRGPPARHRDERIHVASVGPRPRQRTLRPLIIEKEDPILSPRQTCRDEHEFPPHPRMKRMDHTDCSLFTGYIERS